MLEHVSLPVTDLTASKEFYTRALAPLGYKISMEFEGAIGFMEGGHTSFWISEEAQSAKIHVAFLAKSEQEVRGFHAAALAAGGADNGAPGYREYSPDYFAAFVLDADENNIEAVWYDPAKA